MKQSRFLVVTPEKLLSPRRFSIKINDFRPKHDYLKNNNYKKRLFKKILPNLDETQLKKDPLNSVEFRKFGDFSKSCLTQRDSRLHKSCKIKKKGRNDYKLETSEISLSSSNEIPQLSYRHFERFHLPSVRARINIKTYSPKQLPKAVKEPEEQILEVEEKGPTRIHISDYSKEYSMKINRVQDIVKMTELEV